MNNSFFNKLIAQISTKLKMLEELGVPITTQYIDEKVNELVGEFRNIPNFEFTEQALKLLKFKLKVCSILKLVREQLNSQIQIYLYGFITRNHK